MDLISLPDVIDELGKVQYALMEMERIKGSEYTKAVNAVVEARAWLTLISNSGLAAAWAHNLNLKLVPLSSKGKPPRNEGVFLLCCCLISCSSKDT